VALAMKVGVPSSAFFCPTVFQSLQCESRSREPVGCGHSLVAQALSSACMPAWQWSIPNNNNFWCLSKVGFLSQFLSCFCSHASSSFKIIELECLKCSWSFTCLLGLSFPLDNLPTQEEMQKRLWDSLCLQMVCCCDSFCHNFGGYLGSQKLKMGTASYHHQWRRS
jgi:hypothetical protein